MENSISNNFTIYLMLIVCLILLSVDSYELYRISFAWNSVPKFDPVLFNTCIKKDLILKTVYSIFSFKAALAAFLLTLFITISVEFFIDKILTTFIQLVYIIFGPIMMGFCIVAFFNWDDVAYVCDRRNYAHQIFSISNVVSVIGCFIISLIITLASSVYETVVLYINSIVRRENESKILRAIFWWVIIKTNPNVVRNFYQNRRQQDNENDPNQENNRLNNQNV